MAGLEVFCKKCKSSLGLVGEGGKLFVTPCLTCVAVEAEKLATSKSAALAMEQIQLAQSFAVAALQKAFKEVKDGKAS